MTDEGATRRTLLADGAARLRAAGIMDAPRDARALLAHVLDLAPDRLLMDPDAPVPPAQALAYDAAIAARAAHRPVAQITGRRLFWGRVFRITGDVLDPRPETETLIAEALGVPFTRVLDLGTGSGAILLTLLAERGGATGLGVDLSPAALAVARGNARALGVGARAGFAVSDWFGAVSGRFDLIVANPPYIGAGEIDSLSPELRSWEPRMALVPAECDGSGLGAYRRICAGLSHHLAPGGRVLFEVGAAQGAAVAALCRAAGLADLRVLPDLDGRDRVVSARKE